MIIVLAKDILPGDLIGQVNRADKWIGICISSVYSCENRRRLTFMMMSDVLNDWHAGKIMTFIFDHNNTFSMHVPANQS